MFLNTSACLTLISLTKHYKSVKRIVESLMVYNFKVSLTVIAFREVKDLINRGLELVPISFNFSMGKRRGSLLLSICFLKFQKVLGHRTCSYFVLCYFYLLGKKKKCFNFFFLMITKKQPLCHFLPIM